MSGGRLWTPEEDARLREMVAAGHEYRGIAISLRRSQNACKSRAWLLRIGLSRAAILANRAKGRERFKRNEKKVARRLERVMRVFTPDERAVRAEELRQRNRAGITGLKGRHHRPEVCARISAANKGKKRTAEQRQNLSVGAKKRWATWRANRPEALAKAAMLADKAADRFSVWFGDDARPPETPSIWCSQCERQVTAARAEACDSRFCKAKALAA